MENEQTDHPHHHALCLGAGDPEGAKLSLHRVLVVGYWFPVVVGIVYVAWGPIEWVWRWRTGRALEEIPPEPEAEATP